MWSKHSMNIAQQLMPIYNTTTENKNKSFVALKMARHQHATRAEGAKDKDRLPIGES